MTNLVDRFKKQVVGSAGKIFDYLPVIAPNGDFKRISDIDVLVNSYSVILQTPTRTYDHDPSFGCDLNKYVFAPADSITKMEIENLIRNQLLMLEPRAKLKTFSVEYYKNMKGFLLTVIVSFKDEDKQVSVPITEASIK